MKKSLIYALVLTSLVCNAERYITYGLNGGRFGDNVFNYFKARWLAYKYDLVFLYKPFGYSSFLGMHQLEKRYSDSYANNRKIIDVRSENQISKNTDQDVLFVSNFYINLGDYFKFPIENPGFRDLLHKMLEPISPIEKLPLPENILTVAIHVRKGSGNDGSLFSDQVSSNHRVGHNFMDKKMPRKFPPEQYYIDQVNNLSSLLGNPPMYIYVFSDTNNPRAIADQFEKYCTNPNVQFEAREKHGWATTTLDDYYHMAYFDILIRPDSYFSLVSLLLGNNAISIRPIDFHWAGNTLITDTISLHLVDLDQNKEQHVLLKKINDSVKDLIIAHLPEKG